MKAKMIFVLLMLSVGALITLKKASAREAVSYQVFYDELSPYGTWVSVPGYGYVWRPDVAPGFTPYATNGNWVLTDDGWTWVSGYPWGWAPFHYGRWYTDPTYGPIWFPGSVWSPGWVQWRGTEDYYGWAPIAPGISINMAYGNNYHNPHNRWAYVHRNDFGRPGIKNYYCNNYVGNTTIFNNTTIINNVWIDKKNKNKYFAGPGKSDVEKRTGKSIYPMSIKERNMPGEKLGKNELDIYRPQVKGNSYSARKAAPYKSSSFKDMKSIAQKSNQKFVATQAKSQKNEKSSAPKASKQQQTNTYKKTEAAQQQKQTNAPAKSAVIKQQKQTNLSNKTDGGKQQQQVNPSSNAGKGKKPH